VVRCWRGYMCGVRCRLAYAQVMPLPLTVSCFSKIQIGCTFLVPAHQGSPGKRAVKRMCVCVCVSVSNQLQQWTNYCTNFSPKSGGEWGTRPPCQKSAPTASPPHYTPGTKTRSRAAVPVTPTASVRPRCVTKM